MPGRHGKNRPMLKSVEIPFSGHPDKICDQIVENILDEYLKRDPKSRLNIQALGSHGMMMIGGTVDSRADFDVAAIAINQYKKIGFEDDVEPFVNLERPSEDMTRSLINGGAQSTCIVYGYATKQTREYLPRVLVYANAIARRIHDLRCTSPDFGFLLPDGKVQLAMDNEQVISVSVSVQHREEADFAQVQSSILDQVILPIVGTDERVKFFVNSAGRFCSGGFGACGGASGRKELADTYGGLIPHGGASYTGKDPYSPARAGTFMSRYVAKKLVSEGVSSSVMITVGYTIGHAEPVFLRAVGADGKDITALIKDRFDFRPEAIVERLQLANPIYTRVSNYGIFGRESVPWEDVSSAS